MVVPILDNSNSRLQSAFAKCTLVNIDHTTHPCGSTGRGLDRCRRFVLVIRGAEVDAVHTGVGSERVDGMLRSDVLGCCHIIRAGACVVGIIGIPVGIEDTPLVCYEGTTWDSLRLDVAYSPLSGRIQNNFLDICVQRSPLLRGNDPTADTNVLVTSNQFVRIKNYVSIKQESSINCLPRKRYQPTRNL